MKKRIKDIKKTMFIFITTSLFVCKNIMPMHSPYLSTVETDRNIKEIIRENVLSNIGIRDFVRTIKRLKSLFIDNEIPYFPSTDLSLGFEDLPHELQLNIVNFLSPTNRGVLRCCCTLFRDEISQKTTDRDLLVYPNDIATIFKEICNASRINAASIISKETLIKLLKAGRNGLFCEADEHEILNIYNHLIDIDDYYLNTSLQTNNPPIKELAHFFYPESMNSKRLIFLFNKILSIGFGFPEILSSQFMLNLDVIFNSFNLIFSSNRMENFQNIKSSVFKKIKLQIVEFKRIFNTLNIENQTILEKIQNASTILLIGPKLITIFIKLTKMFEDPLLFIKIFFLPINIMDFDLRDSNIIDFCSEHGIPNHKMYNIMLTFYDIIWQIIANPLYDSALGPYEY